MTTVQIKISDEIIKVYGIEAIKNRLQKFMDMEELVLSATNIDNAIKSVGLDNDVLWQKARQQAWEEFKDQNLKGLSE